MTKIEDVLVALRRVIRATDLHSKQLIKTASVTAPQLLLLQAIHRHGDVMIGTLAKDVSLSQATVTTILDRLESRDLVYRLRSEEAAHERGIGLAVVRVEDRVGDVRVPSLAAVLGGRRQLREAAGLPPEDERDRVDGDFRVAVSLGHRRAGGDPQGARSRRLPSAAPLRWRRHPSRRRKRGSRLLAFAHARGATGGDGTPASRQLWPDGFRTTSSSS
jgi:hypothetical protein